MSSEDSDFIDAYTPSVSGGKKKQTRQACRMNVQALVLLKKLKWNVKSSPYKAELRLFDNTDPKTRDCGNYMSKNLFEHPLCSGKVTLMAPVIDPSGGTCEIVFFE